MRVKKILLAPAVLIMFLCSMAYAPGIAYGLDEPHNADDEVLTVNCGNCHYDPASPPPWTTMTPSQDNTIMNNLCLSCHRPGVVTDKYADVLTHSSYQTSNKYGTWVVECRTCHQPHYQQQVRSYPSLGSLVTGTVTAVDYTTGTFAVSTALSANTYTNYLLIPNTAYPSLMYRITGNTASTLTVMGAVNKTYVVPNRAYAIKYGKMVKSQAVTPNSGTKTVKFFNNEGPNSFADGDVAIDGICQVCHTKTAYFRNDGTLQGTHAQPAGSNCTSCHRHSEGFKASCDACHGAPPISATLGPGGLAKYGDNSGTGSNNPGKHQKHAVVLGYSCDTCHSNYVMPEATKAVDIGFRIFGTAGGSYDGQSSVTYTSRNGSAVTNPGSGARACTNIYCHSNVQGTNGLGGPSQYASPQWLDTALLQCGSCHKADGSGDGSRMDTGSHTRHVSNAAQNMPCTNCHRGAGYGTNRHVDNLIDVSIDSNYGGAYSLGDHAPGQGYGRCSSAYCHSTAQGVSDPVQPPSYATPTWGQPFSGTCGGGACHAVGHAHPSDSGYSALASGSHAPHLLYRFDQEGNCQACHYDPDYATCINCHARTKNHANRSIEVAFNPSFPTGAGGESGTYSGDSVPQTPYGSCSSLYCHSPGTKGSPPYDSPSVTAIAWGGEPLPADCTGCHSGDNNAVNKMSTGSHLKHIQNIDCANCHGNTVSNSRTLNPAIYLGTLTYGHRYHSDGWVNIKFTGVSSPSGSYAGQTSPLNYRTPGSPYSSCSNLYCHSNGTSVSTGTIVSNISPTWGSGALACNACHGNPPDYSNGSPKANSHVAHVISNGYACNVCHYDTTRTGTTIYSTSNHVNKSYDVIADGVTASFTYTFDTAGGTCTDISCHGGAAKTWGQ